MKLEDAIVRKARESAEVKTRFFTESAPAIARCAEAMARAFDAGARLFTMGNGGSACDADHVAVEFMHPIFEKRRPLPAESLSADASLVSAIANDEDFALALAKKLRMLGRPGDVVLAISTSGKSANLRRALQAAREARMLTIGFCGKDGGHFASLCDHNFVVPSFSIHRIQETHETLLHVLWDAVHIARGEEDIL